MKKSSEEILVDELAEAGITVEYAKELMIKSAIGDIPKSLSRERYNKAVDFVYRGFGDLTDNEIVFEFYAFIEPAMSPQKEDGEYEIPIGTRIQNGTVDLWECEVCGKRFVSEETCAAHEKKCKG